MTTTGWSVILVFCFLFFFSSVEGFFFKINIVLIFYTRLFPSRPNDWAPITIFLVAADGRRRWEVRDRHCTVCGVENASVSSGSHRVCIYAGGQFIRRRTSSAITRPRDFSLVCHVQTRRDGRCSLDAGHGRNPKFLIAF